MVRVWELTLSLISFFWITFQLPHPWRSGLGRDGGVQLTMVLVYDSLGESRPLPRAHTQQTHSCPLLLGKKGE